MNRYGMSIGLLLMVFGSLPAPALSAENFGAHTPSVDEIEDALNPPPTRGLKPGAASQLTERPSISMQIQFAFNSDKISPQSVEALDNLSKALQGERLRSKSMEVIGHTDSIGSPNYNLALSKRRAGAVKDYLVKNGVDDARLTVVGKGLSEPLNKVDPTAAENRRVQFSVLTK